MQKVLVLSLGLCHRVSASGPHLPSLLIHGPRPYTQYQEVIKLHFFIFIEFEIKNNKIDQPLKK